MGSFQLEKTDQQLSEAFQCLSNPRDVALLLDVAYSHLTYLLYRRPPAESYRTFSIRKKSGDTRLICAPRSALAAVQSKLHQVLQAVYKPRPCVHGFVRGRGIHSNAAVHQRRANVFNTDLKDFFGTINFGRVFGMLKARPYELPENVAAVLAQICCFNNALPQGAPTSPVVSNMICAKLDGELMRLAKKTRCTYTRYADDITFSTSRKLFPQAIGVPVDGIQSIVGSQLAEIIESNGFEVSPNKTRLLNCYVRQEVTGLTVNEFPNVRRKYVRQVRAMLHAWEKFGYDDAEKEYREKYDMADRGPGRKAPSFRMVLRGKLEFLGMVRGKDDRIFVRLCQRLHELDPDFRLPFAALILDPTKDFYDVFICHAKEDKEDVVRPIVEAIKARGITPWYDEEKITWGDSIVGEVNKGLKNSRYVMVVLSPAFMKKNWPKVEFEAALNKEATTGEKLVLPLLVGSEEERKKIMSEYVIQNHKLHLVWDGNAEVVADSIQEIL